MELQALRMLYAPPIHGLVTPGPRGIRNKGDSMEVSKENMTDPFNLGIYVIEVGMVAAILYGMVVLVALFKPVI
jgi:hypothetical protein